MQPLDYKVLKLYFFSATLLVLKGITYMIIVICSSERNNNEAR